MATEIKRRRPGAGRKPQGKFKGNSAVLNLRVTAEVRQALERAAKKSGASLSQEAQHRLDASFAEGRSARKRRSDLRALTVATTMVAEFIERATGKHWQEDAFTSEALRFGVEFLIRHFGGAGEVVVPGPVAAAAAKMPPDPGGRYTSPSGVGYGEAGLVIGMIERWSMQDIADALGSNAPAEWDTQWRLLRDLGSKWKRNLK